MTESKCTDVLALLRSKTRCLERYFALSAIFLEQAEQGDLSELGPFHDQREAHLKAIDLYERKLSEAVTLLDPAYRTPELVERVRMELLRKEEIVQRILSVDLQIIEKIERAKSSLLIELSQSRKSREILGKFKSSQSPLSGEELDRKL